MYRFNPSYTLEIPVQFVEIFVFELIHISQSFLILSIFTHKYIHKYIFMYLFFNQFFIDRKKIN